MLAEYSQLFNVETNGVQNKGCASIFSALVANIALFWQTKLSTCIAVIMRQFHSLPPRSVYHSTLTEI